MGAVLAQSEFHKAGKFHAGLAEELAAQGSAIEAEN